MRPFECLIPSALALVVASFTALASLSGCASKAPETTGTLNAATTASQEKTALEQVMRSSERVAFSAFSKDHHKLDMSQPEWWKQLDYIVLSHGKGTVRHRMIDPENVFILMRE